MTVSLRKLAWSSTGSIAQISEDGTEISFRTCVRDQKTGAYKLSNKSKMPVEASNGKFFVHLQFNGLGSDMVAVGKVGGTGSCGRSRCILAAFEEIGRDKVPGSI